MPSRLFYINLTLVCLAVSFGAQLICFAVPGWLTVNIDTSFLYENVYDTVVSQSFALWYVVICVNGTCQTKSYDQLRQDREKDKTDVHSEFQHSFDFDFTTTYSGFPFSRLLEFQIEAACALVLILMCLLLVRKQKKSFMIYMNGRIEEDPRLSRFCMAFCYAVISGSVILVPSSKFIDVNEDLKGMSDNSELEIEIPYALICACVGGILALVSCLLIVGTMCKSISLDNFSSDNISTAVNDGSNGNNQLVPLVQPSAETSTGGFTQSVSPGRNIRKHTVVMITNKDKHRGNRYKKGVKENEVFNTDHAKTSQNIERPPSAYDKSG